MLFVELEEKYDKLNKDMHCIEDVGYAVLKGVKNPKVGESYARILSYLDKKYFDCLEDYYDMVTSIQRSPYYSFYGDCKDIEISDVVSEGSKHFEDIKGLVSDVIDKFKINNKTFKQIKSDTEYFGALLAVGFVLKNLNLGSQTRTDYSDLMSRAYINFIEANKVQIKQLKYMKEHDPKKDFIADSLEQEIEKLEKNGRDLDSKYYELVDELERA